MTARLLAERHVRRRPATPDDDGFLRELYATTRTDIDVLGWTDAQRAWFCDLQWRAQRAGYRATRPNAVDEVVEVDGRPAGRLLVDSAADPAVLVDVALLPALQGQGLGTALVAAVQAEAAAAGKGVVLCVEHANPARRLYERLGFVATGTSGLHTELRWAP